MSSPIAFPEIYKAAFEDFIIPTFEVAPSTTIQNRALVTRSLKAIAGVERIHTKSILLLSNEFGSTNEQVHEIDTKDSRIRFVGDWVNTSSTTGSGITTTTIGHYIEVTFYGTGFNLLTRTSGSFDFRASVDGGAEGANLFTTGYSSVLDARNYSPNAILPVTSGLSVGWHTIKIRNATSASLFYCFGVEVLNQRTDLGVYSGAGISNGSIQGLSSLTASAFNTGIVGARGARVVKYLQNGMISQAVQEVDNTSQYFSLADHTNEEVVRRINFREYGANRSDDFSTLGASTTERAFTLEDGSSTLVGASVWADVNGMIMGNILNGFTTITFTGTGLDIISLTNGSPGDTITVYVDGISIGNLPAAVTLTKPQLIKVCSGLPYGSHSVRFKNTSDLSDRYVQDFIIYQPKTPSIPNGALEIANYNILATFIPNTSVGTLATGMTASTGILRMMNVRGMTYVGTYTLGAINNNFPSGYAEALTQANGNYIEYTFWGTGYDQRFLEQTARAALINVTLNGVALTTANFPTALTANTGNGVSMNLGTGVLDMQAASTVGFGGVSVYNLPLAKYTLRFTKGDALATVLEVACLDVITPIHVNDSSFKIGNQSLTSPNKFSPEKIQINGAPDLSRAKAWVVFDGVNQILYSSYNVQAVLRTATGIYYVYFEKPFKIRGSSPYGLNGSVLVSSSLAETQNSGFTNSYCLIETSSSSGVKTNAGLITMVAYGELADE
jgi:hypothetical protein